MAGIGFDADVVTRHHLARVGRSGLARPTNRVSYVEPVLRSSLEYRFPPLTVRIADPGREEVLTGTSVFLFNLPRYALGLPFAPTALGDDGLLDLVVFRNAGPFQALYYLWLVVRGLHLDTPGVFHRRVRKVVVSAVRAGPGPARRRPRRLRRRGRRPGRCLDHRGAPPRPRCARALRGGFG